MDTAIEPRDTSGRFKKGHGGRPKGSTNRRRAVSANEFSASVAAEAARKLEDLIEKSLSVVEEQLSQGNLKAAIWALDRVLPPERSRLSEAIPDADLTSVEGIVNTAQTVGQMVAEGRLGLDEGSRFITILANCGQLRGFLEFAELKAMLKALNEPRAQRTINPAVQFPTWGNLSQSR